MFCEKRGSIRTAPDLKRASFRRRVSHPSDLTRSFATDADCPQPSRCPTRRLATSTDSSLTRSSRVRESILRKAASRRASWRSCARCVPVTASFSSNLSPQPLSLYHHLLPGIISSPLFASRIEVGVILALGALDSVLSSSQRAWQSSLPGLVDRRAARARWRHRVGERKEGGGWTGSGSDRRVARYYLGLFKLNPWHGPIKFIPPVGLLIGEAKSFPSRASLFLLLSHVASFTLRSTQPSMSYHGLSSAPFCLHTVASSHTPSSGVCLELYYAPPQLCRPSDR